MTEKQAYQINRKLQYLSLDRKNYLYAQRKSQNLEKLHSQMASTFQPKINKINKVEKPKKESPEGQKQHRRNRA